VDFTLDGARDDLDIAVKPCRMLDQSRYQQRLLRHQPAHRFLSLPALALRLRYARAVDPGAAAISSLDAAVRGVGNDR
jgi:hypothetical protein